MQRSTLLYLRKKKPFYNYKLYIAKQEKMQNITKFGSHDICQKKLLSESTMSENEASLYDLIQGRLSMKVSNYIFSNFS